jgi:hypothetical protein
MNGQIVKRKSAYSSQIEYPVFSNINQMEQLSNVRP